MKALCVQQPWAALILAGKKTLEVRSWTTNFRGEFVLCASAQANKANLEQHKKVTGPDLPRGVALAVCRVLDVRMGDKYDEEDAWSFVDYGDYVFELEVVEKLKPFPIKGQLNFFELPENLLANISKVHIQHAEEARKQVLLDAKRRKERTYKKKVPIKTQAAAKKLPVGTIITAGPKKRTYEKMKNGRWCNALTELQYPVDEFFFLEDKWLAAVPNDA